MPYGYDDADWQAAKDEAKEILAARARVRGMMSYSELAQQITTIAFDYNDARFNRWFLHEISVEEHAAARGMMTALVVYKEGSMEPGPGFYELAEELGLDTDDIVACWVDHSTNRRVGAVRSGFRHKPLQPAGAVVLGSNNAPSSQGGPGG